MSEERYIHIVRWQDFQHYGNRDPVWIRTYTRLLSDHRYRGLSGHVRGVLHGLWLEYARSRSQIIYDTAAISSQLGCKVTTAHLQQLETAGFVVFSASSVLAQIRVEESREDKPLAAPAAEAPPKPPKQKPATERKPRPPDLLWDELVAIVGASPAGLERAKWNTALKSLRESGATPDRLRAAAVTYRRTYPDCALTPLALANNWTTLVSPSNGHAVESAEAFQARIRQRERESSQSGWAIPVKGMDA